MGHFHFVARASKQLVIMQNGKLVPLLLKNAHEDHLHEHFAFRTKTCGSFSILSEENTFVIKQRNQKVSLCDRLSPRTTYRGFFFRVTAVRVKQREGNAPQRLCPSWIMATDLT